MTELPETSQWESLFKWAIHLTGFNLPKPVAAAFGILILIALTTCILLVIVSAIAKIKKVWAETFIPKRYKSEQRGRARARQQFATYLATEVQRLNRAENWRDDEFSELEAEVETTGSRRSHFSFINRRGVLLEKSLSRGLERSTERLILVEGDPGSGKSVSLRHIVYQASLRASKSKRLDSVLPIYLNLKEIRRKPAQTIDRDLIMSFVISTIRRINDRFIDEFVDREFNEGIRNGSWLFIFDSFDEIPDILSSTENDDVIHSYSEAISDFLGGVNACRGIVASRVYRGPVAAAWTTFRIVALSPQRQRDLVSKSLLSSPRLASEVEQGLATTTDDVRIMARNPMFLGLLCEHVRLGHQFPANSFDVFSKYIEYRLSRDEARVTARFELGLPLLRDIAEQVAYCMTEDASIGLSPDLDELTASLVGSGFHTDRGTLALGISALSYLRLGRIEDSDGSQGNERFTFAHRRFQEYFATRVVIEGQRPVDPLVLMTDGRWRETAVVLLQTGEPHAIADLLQAADNLVDEWIEALTPDAAGRNLDMMPFRWPRGLFHVLDLLQAGSNADNDRLPVTIRLKVDKLLTSVSARPNLLDKKLALEVAGAATQKTLVTLMQKALAERSQWLGDIVYQQASRLAKPIPRIYAAIRLNLVRLALDHRVKSEYISTRAFLSRLPDSGLLLSFLRLAALVPVLDILGYPAVLAFLGLVGWVPAKFLLFSCAVFLVSCFVARFRGTWFVFGLAIYLRLLSVVALYILYFPELIKHGASASHAIVAILPLYAAAFAPCALLCIKAGLLPRVPTWPLVHFGAAYHIFDVFSRRKQLFLRGLAFMAGSFVPFALLGIAYRYGLIRPIVVAFFFGFLALVGFVGFIITVSRFVIDASSLRRWRAAYTSATDPDAFSETFVNMKTAWGGLVLLRWLSGKSIETCGAEWTATLVKLIPTVDLHPRTLNSGDRANLAESPAYGLTTVLSFQLVIERDKILARRDMLFSVLERATKMDRLVQS